jgi:hypothetical protein
MSPRGPGKYDAICTAVRQLTAARGVVVIVIEGGAGSGFSVQADAALTLGLPELLESIIPQIRASLRGGDLDS